MTNDAFISIAQSLPNVETNPHFNRLAFKVSGKRIFATLEEKSCSANVKLSKEDQLIFIDLANEHIFKVPNKWGDQGWTTINLTNTADDVIKEVLFSAYSAI